MGGRIRSYPRHVRHDSVAMAMAVCCVLNIQQLWTSGDQTREPILMKFGTPHQINTSMTVV